MENTLPISEQTFDFKKTKKRAIIYLFLSFLVKLCALILNVIMLWVFKIDGVSIIEYLYGSIVTVLQIILSEDPELFLSITEHLLDYLNYFFIAVTVIQGIFVFYSLLKIIVPQLNSVDKIIKKIRLERRPFKDKSYATFIIFKTIGIIFFITLWIFEWWFIDNYASFINDMPSMPDEFIALFYYILQIIYISFIFGAINLVLTIGRDFYALYAVKGYLKECQPKI